jgi:hypothetical protein
VSLGVGGRTEEQKKTHPTEVVERKNSGKEMRQGERVLEDQHEDEDDEEATGRTGDEDEEDVEPGSEENGSKRFLDGRFTPDRVLRDEEVGLQDETVSVRQQYERKEWDEPDAS